MTSTNKQMRKAVIFLLFLLGLVIGFFLRYSLVPLESVLEQKLLWLLGFFIHQVILFSVVVGTAIVLYRYRRGHYAIRALGWGIWAGFLISNLFFMALILAVALGGPTP